MIHGVIDIPSKVEDSFRIRGLAMGFSIDMSIERFGSGGNLGTEGSVSAIHSSDIRGHGKWPIDFGVLRIEFRLVEVVCIVHICAVDG
jgi:hypothetical protein